MSYRSRSSDRELQGDIAYRLLGYRCSLSCLELAALAAAAAAENMLAVAAVVPVCMFAVAAAVAVLAVGSAQPAAVGQPAAAFESAKSDPSKRFRPSNAENYHFRMGLDTTLQRFGSCVLRRFLEISQREESCSVSLADSNLKSV